MEENTNLVEEFTEMAESMENVEVTDLSEDTSGSGKGKLIGLAVAGVAALAVVAGALFRKHKKSKAAKQETEEDYEDDEYVDEDIEQDFDKSDDSAEEVKEPVKDSEEK